MLRRFVPFLGTSAFALTAILIVAEPAAAQQFNRGGGFGYGSSWSGNRGGYGGGYYSPYYGGYGAYSGVRYYNNGYTPNYAPYYGRSYAPSVYQGGYSPYASAQSILSVGDGRMSMYAPENTNAVQINVRVPASAEIWFDGNKTTQTGASREFVSPALDNDAERSYEIRATWTENGRPVDQTRTVTFHAGDRITVNFMTPREQGTEVIGKSADVLSPSSPKPVPPIVRDRDTPEPRGLVSKDADRSTHDGKVVSIAEDKLVMTGKGDKEHSHALTADVTLICDGKVCKFDDIKTGMKIRVTTKKDYKQTVTRIEGLDKNGDFETRD